MPSGEHGQCWRGHGSGDRSNGPAVPSAVGVSYRHQAADFQLRPPTLLANGFDFSRYSFNPIPSPAWAGWAHRPEKGSEDAAQVAAAQGWPLRVWGLKEDAAYAAAVEASVPAGTD